MSKLKIAERREIMKKILFCIILCGVLLVPSIASAGYVDLPDPHAAPKVYAI
jgi:hypothetical protein